jgi:hypothetical protein
LCGKLLVLALNLTGEAGLAGPSTSDSSDLMARIPEAWAETRSRGSWMWLDCASSSRIGGSGLSAAVGTGICVPRSILIAGTCSSLIRCVGNKKKFTFHFATDAARDAMIRTPSNNSNRASGTFDVKAHNFGLFSLVKILSVSSGSKVKSKSKLDGSALNNKQDVTIDVVAQGGYVGHEFLALYCSNGKKIILKIISQLNSIRLPMVSPTIIHYNYNRIEFKYNGQWLRDTNRLNFSYEDHFIFRYVGDSGVPLVRRLPWLKVLKIALFFL